MAGIALVKAHLVKTSYNKRSQPSCGMVADISPEVLFIVHEGDSTIDYGESHALPLPSIFYALLLTANRAVG